MTDRKPADRITRRDMLTRLAGAALSLVGLPALAQPRRGRPALAPWDDHFELAVDLEINQPEGYRAHRPYVAVWVEDPAGKPVRTLTLWVNTRGRGERYIRELRRWFRAEQTREGAGGSDLVSTISSATRLPGKYSVVWNGRDDDGRPVSQGPYTLYIEAAREHGTYQLIRQEITVASRPFSTTLGGNEEISGARVEYRRKG